MVADKHEAVNQNPESADFALMAQEFVRKEDFDRAISLLTEGIRSHPAYATGYLILGTIHSQRGEQEKATEFFEKALALDPQNPRLLFLLGRQYMTSSPDRAQELLWKARRYEPEHKQLAEVFHEALEVTGSTDESVETIFIGHEEPSEITVPQEDEIVREDTVQDEEEIVLIEVVSPTETPVDQGEEKSAE